MAGQHLPTAVVGSYSMPGWLERAKNDYLRRRITAHDLDEMHDAAVKAAIKDQEVAGLDTVSDGELRRDNMIDYFAMRLPLQKIITLRMAIWGKRSRKKAESMRRSRNTKKK